MRSRALWAAGAALLITTIVAAETRPKVVVKYDFEDGKTSGMEASGGGSLEITERETFSGEGKALKSVNTRTYLGVSFYQRNPIKENGTRLSFAYKVSGIKGDLYVQCNAEGAGNLHTAVKPTVHDKWAIGTADLGKLIDWGGKHPNSKGYSLKNIQIYGGQKGGKGILIVDNVVVYEGTDKSPPGAPASVSGGIEDYRVRVSWKAASDETFVAAYEVYRGTSPDFMPAPENTVGRTGRLEIADDTISNFGTFYYKVRAVDALGNAGAFSAPFRLEVNDED